MDAESAIGMPTKSVRSGAISSRISDLIDTQFSQDISSMVLDEDRTTAVASTIESQSRPSSTLPLTAARFNIFKTQIKCSRFDIFRKRLAGIREHFMDERGSNPTVHLNEIMERINLNLRGSDHFELYEVQEAIQTMTDQNMGVWYQDEIDSIMFI